MPFNIPKEEKRYNKISMCRELDFSFIVPAALPSVCVHLYCTVCFAVFFSFLWLKVFLPLNSFVAVEKKKYHDIT